MLPWWFWVLIWTVLVLATLLFLVLAGIKLFRGFMKLLNETGEAGDKIAEAMEPDSAPVDYGEQPQRAPAGVAALFRDPVEERASYANGKAHRIEVRRARRVQRKARHGRPQRVSDLKLF